MAFVSYTPSADDWKNLKSESYGQRFYPIQKGEGGSIKLVSPAEASVQRAKSELKRQLSETSSHAMAHMTSGHRRRNIKKSKSKLKPKKKQATSKVKKGKVVKKKTKKVVKKKKK